VRGRYLRRLCLARRPSDLRGRALYHRWVSRAPRDIALTNKLHSQLSRLQARAYP
jgi:hypothetical protein